MTCDRGALRTGWLGCVVILGAVWGCDDPGSGSAAPGDFGAEVDGARMVSADEGTTPDGPLEDQRPRFSRHRRPRSHRCSSRDLRVGDADSLWLAAKELLLLGLNTEHPNSIPALQRTHGREAAIRRNREPAHHVSVRDTMDDLSRAVRPPHPGHFAVVWSPTDDGLVVQSSIERVLRARCVSR